MLTKLIKLTLMVVSILVPMTGLARGEQAANLGDNIICTKVQPISWRMILPETQNIAGARSTTLNVTACRGEFEPASFVLTALENVDQICFKPGELKSGDHTLPASCVDIRWVKCWYQCESAWVGIQVGNRQPVLVPELLLKDDSLVKVDQVAKKNYLKLSFPNETKYVCVSDPKIVRKTLDLPNSQFPVADSPTLLPTNVQKGKNKQVWVTVRVPDDAAAGEYAGYIDVTVAGKVVGKLTLMLTVLPFELAEPAKTFSLYYHGKLTEGPGAVGTNVKNEIQLRAELKNMRDHGVKNPMVGMALEKNRPLLEKYLTIRKELGMTGGPLYYMNGETFYWDFKKANLANLKRKTQEVVKLAKAHGFTDAYVYGVDEARVEFVAGQHSTIKAVHEAGGKVFQAGYWGTVDVIGDLMDLQIYAGPMSRDQARKWHAKGNKVFNYGNPQVGVENPWLYRQKYGLGLYHYEFDGVMTYAYQHGFGHPWNDFDAVMWRDHTFAYPTTNGVIDTIAWEGFREAVDDVRYISTLEKYISDNPPKVTKSVRRFLKDKIHHYEGIEDYDKFRKQIIEKINTLHIRKGARFVFPKFWKFNKDPENEGEKLGWQKPSFDDTKWISINVPSGWEKTKAGQYDGYAWYRAMFRIPPDLQGKKLTLHFAGVDEQAWVYLNGKFIGEHTEKSTGQPVSKIWSKSFSFPLMNLDMTGVNTLCVRVHDSGHQGGIHEPVFLKAQ